MILQASFHASRRQSAKALRQTCLPQNHRLCVLMRTSLSSLLQEQPQTTRTTISQRATFSTAVATADRTGRPSRRRRQRQYEGKHSLPGSVNDIQNNKWGALHVPYDHGKDNMDDYLNEALLSPWVPSPDVVARKLFDLAQPQVNDIHIDLGSGDGRINFHAIDYGVKESIGVDVDANMVKIANERRSKRHPLPKNLSFHVGNLLDIYDPVWEMIVQAQPTLWTMYFAPPAMQLFRPILESKLQESNVARCKILTIGSSMPGWNVMQYEVVLGTTIHLYEYPSSLYDNDNANQEGEHDVQPDLLRPHSSSPELQQFVSQHEQFQGSNVIDHTGRHPIRGFNPSIFDETDSDDDHNWLNENENDPDNNSSSSGVVQNAATATPACRSSKPSG